MNATGLWILLLTSVLVAQTPGEEEAYLKVSEAREKVRLGADAGALERFEREAEGFLAAYPTATGIGAIELWRGDLLRESRPREALLAYGRSELAEAKRRAADLLFRHEAPPPLQLDSWVGGEVDPSDGSGAVTLLVFFSVTHPQTARLLPHLVHLHARWGVRGLRIGGIAAVVDDAKNQTPARIAERLGQRARALPFPVAIDRQATGLPTQSLRTYRGSTVPWAVVIDRFGRMTWLDGIALQPNALARFELAIEAALDAPGPEALRDEALGGDAKAIAELAANRSLASARALLAVAKSGEGDAPIREQAIAALGTLLPAGMALDPLPSAATLRALRYDFRSDRLTAPSARAAGR